VITIAVGVMKYAPITIARDSDLVEAARLMKRNRMGGIPVLDSDNNLVGIITKTDIIKALRSDN
jgi:CBS domain-containing protein